MFNKFFLDIVFFASVTIGKNIVFTNGGGYNDLSSNSIGCLRVEPFSKIVIGENVGISSAKIWCKKSIIIGPNCKIGADCIILDNDCHRLVAFDRLDLRHDCEGTISKPIIIEDNVLIGTRSIILKEVAIGRGSIIGTGSVVTKSIPANSIDVGNLCKIIRKLN